MVTINTRLGFPQGEVLRKKKKNLFFMTLAMTYKTNPFFYSFFNWPKFLLVGEFHGR